MAPRRVSGGSENSQDSPKRRSRSKASVVSPFTEVEKRANCLLSTAGVRSRRDCRKKLPIRRRDAVLVRLLLLRETSNSASAWGLSDIGRPPTSVHHIVASSWWLSGISYARHSKGSAFPSTRSVSCSSCPIRFGTAPALTQQASGVCKTRNPGPDSRRHSAKKTLYRSFNPLVKSPLNRLVVARISRSVSPRGRSENPNPGMTRWMPRIMPGDWIRLPRWNQDHAPEVAPTNSNVRSTAVAGDGGGLLALDISGTAHFVPVNSQERIYGHTHEVVRSITAEHCERSLS